MSGSALANLKSGGRRWPIHLTLLVLSVIWILPVLGVTITSLRRPADISATGWWTVLQDPRLTLDNYANVINSLGFGKAFLNSILITVPSTVLPIAIGSLAAFAFAWLRFWGRRTLFLIVVALMVLPVQAGFVPILRGGVPPPAPRGGSVPDAADHAPPAGPPGAGPGIRTPGNCWNRRRSMARPACGRSGRS